MPFQYAPPTGFDSKVANFPERVYAVHNPSSRIHKLMWALLEVGIGRLENAQTTAGIGQQSLSGTMFSELDDFFSFLGVYRLPTEKYSYNPEEEPLTLEQWQEVIAKDSMFRMRIMKFLQSLTRGGTIEGLEMLAYAASGVPCQILELWRVSSGSVQDFSPSQWRGYKMDKSFLVIPKEQINQQQKAAIIHLIDLLKPADTVCAVLTDPNRLSGYEKISIRWTAASNHYYSISKVIVRNTSQPYSAETTLVPNSLGTEVPTYAFMDSTDQIWDLNSDVNLVQATVESPYYSLVFGELSAAINDTDDISYITVLVTDKTKDPAASVFTIQIDNEIMTVIDRESTGNPDEYTYTVIRGEDSTAKVTHSVGKEISTNILRLDPIYSVEGAIQTEWIDIPPMPVEEATDSQGNVVPLWTSEEEYLAWFKNKVYAMGAEIKDNQYRLPTQYATPSGDEFTAEDALAPPVVTVELTMLPS